MLDTLTDMEVANTIMKSTGDKKQEKEAVNALDKRFEELKLEEMTPLEHKSSEYKALSDYLVKSSGTQHGIRYRLEDIFRIERVGETDRFAKSEYAKLKKSDKRLLWYVKSPYSSLVSLSELVPGTVPAQRITVESSPRASALLHRKHP